jgi:hypothetical protein
MPFSWLRQALRRHGTGKVLVAALLVQLVPIAAPAVLVWLGILGGFTTSDKITAEGDIFVIGALVYAVVGTAIAILAWLNATEKPVLRWESWGAFTKQPDSLLADWSWNPELRNDGHVAARFVALRVTFEGCVFRALGPLPSWRLSPPGSDVLNRADWSGGADVVVHAGFDFPVPPLWGQVQMTPGVEPNMLVELVADNFTKTTARMPLALIEDLVEGERAPGRGGDPAPVSS